MSDHLHLAWYGFELCHDEGCSRPLADISGDRLCADPDCEGGCEAARHNAERREIARANGEIG